MTAYEHRTVRCANPRCGRAFKEGETAVMVLWQHEDMMGWVRDNHHRPYEQLEPTCLECASALAKEADDDHRMNDIVTPAGERGN